MLEPVEIRRHSLLKFRPEAETSLRLVCGIVVRGRQVASKQGNNVSDFRIRKLFLEFPVGWFHLGEVSVAIPRPVFSH